MKTRRLLLLCLILCVGLPEPLSAQSQLYWTERDGMRVQRSLLDGSNTERVLQGYGLDRLDNLALDRERGKLYWTDYTPARSHSGRIMRSDLDRANIEVILDGLGDPFGLVIDPEQGHLYWAEDHNKLLLQADLDGSNRDTLVTGTGFTNGLALDVVHQQLYWTEREGIRRISLDGSLAQEVVPNAPGRAGAMAVDGIGEYLYWGIGGTIQRARLDGTEITDLVTDQDNVESIDIDVDSNTMCWVGGQRIHCADLDGSDLQDLITGLDGPAGIGIYVEPPATVDLLRPQDGEINVSTTAMLTWAEPPGATRYDVQVAVDPAFQSIVARENTPHAFFNFVAPVAEKTYYWRVRATNPYGRSAWSPVRYFEVGATGPLAAVLQAPGPDTVVNTRPSFTWIKASEAVSHHLQVSLQSNFSTAVIDVPGLDRGAYDDARLEEGMTYYWRVIGAGEDGATTATRAWRFFTRDTHALDPILLTAPVDGAVDVSPYPSFAWSVVGAAPRYHLQISTDSAFSNIVFADSSYSRESTHIALRLQAEATYYWRVRARENERIGAWSVPSRFTVAALPQITDPVLYWTTTAGTVQMIDLEGNPVADVFYRPHAAPISLVVDPVEEKLYWIDAYIPIPISDPDTTSDAIWQADLDGTGARVWKTLGPRADPWGPAFDPFTRMLYWSSGSPGRIQRASLDSADPEVIVEETGSIIPDVAVDPIGGFLYWISRGSTGTGAIHRSQLDGSDPQVILTDLAFPNRLVLDVAGGRMYWGNRPLSGNGVPTRIQRSNLDGSALEDIVVEAVDLVRDLVVDVHWDKIYWSDRHALKRVNPDGTGVETVAEFNDSPHALGLLQEPGEVLPKEPVDGMDGVSLTPVLSWHPVPGAAQYQVQVATDAGFTDIVADDTSGINATHTLSTVLSYSTTYYWRVRALNRVGSGFWSTVWTFTVAVGTDVEPVETPIPQTYALNQNYPNPFSGTTTLSFDLPEPSSVTLTIYDVQGRREDVLVSAFLPAGRYRYTWDGRRYAGGVYFIELKTPAYVRTRTLMLVP